LRVSACVMALAILAKKPSSDHNAIKNVQTLAQSA
jgi:hypothetical protein